MNLSGSNLPEDSIECADLTGSNLTQEQFLGTYGVPAKMLDGSEPDEAFRKAAKEREEAVKQARKAKEGATTPDSGAAPV